MDPVEAELARRGLSVGGAATAPVSDDPVEQELARRGLSVDSGPSFTDEATAVLSGPNAVIANMLGFPVDAANWLLRQVGIDSNARFGGSDAIKSGMNALGIATDRTPQTAGGRVAKRVAEELTTAPLMMMGAGAVSKAANLGPTASTVLGSFTSNPGTQLLASTGAGLGGGVAREIAPDSAGADVAGSLVGGVIGSALPSAAQYAWDMGGAITAPFREEGRRAIVGRTLQRASGSGENLGLAVDDALATNPQIVPGSNPTTAQLLRDDGLAATERGLRSDSKVAAQFSQRAANQAAARAEAINSGIPNTQGSAPAVKSAVENRVGQFTEFADDIVARTEEEVRRRLSALGPNTDPEDAGRAIREAIQSRRDALAQIRDRATRPLYDAARSETAAVDPAPALGVIDDALRTAKGDIANALDRARGNFFVRGTGGGIDTTPEGLMGTRQSLTAMLADPAIPPYSKTIIKDAQSRLDEAIEAVSPTFREANRQYRELSIPITRMDERLSGEVLRTNPALARAGGPAYEMPESAVPGKFIRRGPGGPEAARELAEMTAGSPGAQEAITGRLATSLRDYATKEDGTLNPLKWRKWVTDNRAILEQQPELRRQLDSMQSAQAVVDSLAGRQTRTMADMQKGALGYVLKQDPKEAIGSILESKSAAQEMDRLMGVIRRDPNAQAALRRAVVEHGWMGSQSAGAVDSLGNPIVSTDKFLRFLKDNRDALSVAFRGQPQQLRLMEQVAEDLQRSNWSNVGGRVAGSNTSQNLTTANIIGAVFRGTVNPTSLPINATAGRLIQFLYRVPEAQMQEMLVDAMLDPTIARAMLRPATPYNLDAIMRPLQQRLLATTAITSTQDRQDRP